jgi:hypothetical protein
MDCILCFLHTLQICASVHLEGKVKSKHCKPITPCSRFPQRNALRTPFLTPFLIYLKATLFCASCMIAHSAVFWPTDSLSFSVTFVSRTCV